MRVVPLLALALSTIAFSTTGCFATAGWTPSSALDTTEDRLRMRVAAVPTEDEARARWALPEASPWGPYVKLTPLSALDEDTGRMALPEVSELEVVQKAEVSAGLLAEAGLPPGTMWVVDMRGAASVAFGARLSGRLSGKVAAIAVFANQPSERELTPASEVLAALVSMPPDARAPKGSTPVFLLDAWRRAYLDEAFEGYDDNRYSLSAKDFPSAQKLRAEGIRQVIYLVEDARDITSEEEDLRVLFAGYRETGISILMVDLEDLRHVSAPPVWDPRMGTRVTIWGPGYAPVGDPLYRSYSNAYDPFYFTRPRSRMLGGWSPSVTEGLGGRYRTPGAHVPSLGGRSYRGSTPRPGH